MNGEKFNSCRAPQAVGLYPHARKVGNLLFLSGVGPRRPGTNVIPGVMMDGQGNPLGHDIEAQCHSVFENVKIILEEAGSHWTTLVDITVFLTNMKRDFDLPFLLVYLQETIIPFSNPEVETLCKPSDLYLCSLR